MKRHQGMEGFEAMAQYLNGVATRIPLIGVPIEASRSVSESDYVQGRRKLHSEYRSQTLRVSRISQVRRITKGRHVLGEIWSMTLDFREYKAAAGILQFMKLETQVRKFRDGKE